MTLTLISIPNLAFAIRVLLLFRLHHGNGVNQLLSHQTLLQTAIDRIDKSLAATLIRDWSSPAANNQLLHFICILLVLQVERFLWHIAYLKNPVNDNLQWDHRQLRLEQQLTLSELPPVVRLLIKTPYFFFLDLGICVEILLMEWQIGPLQIHAKQIEQVVKITPHYSLGLRILRFDSISPHLFLEEQLDSLQVGLRSEILLILLHLECLLYQGHGLAP